jgi:hypothetical protein
MYSVVLAMQEKAGEEKKRIRRLQISDQKGAMASPHDLAPPRGYNFNDDSYVYSPSRLLTS